MVITLLAAHFSKAYRYTLKRFPFLRIFFKMHNQRSQQPTTLQNRQNMIRIEWHNIVCKRLETKHLEEVRKWRNTKKVNQYMRFREHISPEMQQNWFQSIDNAHNYYFIIEYEGKHIGLTHLKDTDFEKSVSEVGMFIWEDVFRNSYIPTMALSMLLDFAYYFLQLQNTIGIHLKTNQRVITFYRSFGAQFKADIDDHSFIQACTLAQFEQTAPKVKKAINILMGNSENPSVFLEKNNLNDDAEKALQALAAQSKKSFKNKISVTSR